MGILTKGTKFFPPESHRKVLLDCDYKKSSKCKGQWYLPYRDARKTLERNNGNIICLHCSREIKYKGRSNPNCKYKKLNDMFFSEIDTPDKAYLLGWIASDGSIGRNGTISINLNCRDLDIIRKLTAIINEELKWTFKERGMVGFCVYSCRIAEDVINWLKLPGPGKKFDKVRLPQLEENLMWEFLRGYFEGYGYITDPVTSNKRSLQCGISSNSALMLQDIKDFIQIPSSMYKDKIEWYGNNALDFLDRLYKNCENRFLDRKRELYYHWTYWIPALSGGSGKYSGNFPKFKWQAARKDARPPSKSRASDSGYDLTLLELIKKQGQLEIYDTGIKIQPDYGWYCMLVPRSSIIKSGYILANSVGIIDRTYLGNIKVVLWKIDPTAPRLELPNRLVQIIPTPIVHFQIEEVEELSTTERGEGGFGSTGK